MENTDFLTQAPSTPIEPLQLKKRTGLPMHFKVTPIKGKWLVNYANTTKQNVGDNFLVGYSEFRIIEIKESRLVKGDYTGTTNAPVYFQSVLCEGIKIFKNDF